MINVNLTSVLV